KPGQRGESSSKNLLFPNISVLYHRLSSKNKHQMAILGLFLNKERGDPFLKEQRHKPCDWMAAIAHPGLITDEC
ncbi:MAG: hypothetical protein AAGU05_03830, partial [Anaerolineaceae bacterium]